MHHGPSIQRCPVRAREREPLAAKHEHESASTRQGFLPIYILLGLFLSLSYAYSSLSFAFALLRKPLLQSHYFGHITALQSTSPCVTSCRWCVVNIYRLHSCSGPWKRERDADLTLSRASFTYILTWVIEGQNDGHTRNVQSVSCRETSLTGIGQSALILRSYLQNIYIYI